MYLYISLSSCIFTPSSFFVHAERQDETRGPPIIQWVSLGSNTADQLDLRTKVYLQPWITINKSADPGCWAEPKAGFKGFEFP